MSWNREKKTKAANWVNAFPNQVRRVNAETTAGCGHRSDINEIREAVYHPICALFLEAYPVCQRCGKKPSDDVHHSRGRVGLLLFDVRYFISLCRRCHNLTHDNPKESEKLGFMAQRG